MFTILLISREPGSATQHLILYLQSDAKTLKLNTGPFGTFGNSPPRFTAARVPTLRNVC